MGMKYLGIGLLAMGIVLAGLGCDDRQDVKTITVPKTPAGAPPTGPGTTPPAMPPTMPPGQGTPAAGPKWDAPAGWEVDPPKPMREAGYHLGEGAQRADIVITRLNAGGFGMWLANVNRWRAQAGLEPIDEQAAQQLQPKTSTLGGREAKMYDFVGPAGANQQRVVVTMITDGGTVWFVKMQGAADAVAKSMAAYDTLVQSFKFAQ